MEEGDSDEQLIEHYKNMMRKMRSDRVFLTGCALVGIIIAGRDRNDTKLAVKYADWILEELRKGSF